MSIAGRNGHGNLRVMCDIGMDGEGHLSMHRKDGMLLSSMTTRGNHAGQTYFGEEGNPAGWLNFILGGSPADVTAACFGGIPPR